jgi:hypothetical protein
MRSIMSKSEPYSMISAGAGRPDRAKFWAIVSL